VIQVRLYRFLADLDYRVSPLRGGPVMTVRVVSQAAVA
jgi:hypothetical protein